ncbi:MAG TPA: NADP-specific glutamate dehydrogenase [Acidimicrobiales bacterium]|nr:NADP-specific glutamate dehydrogenase [Acidimicrobiales bacterium]
MSSASYVEQLLEQVSARNANQSEFLQAVGEVVRTLGPVLDRYPRYRKNKVLERMVEPERIITFRVTWTDDAGVIQVNRGFRVQASSTLGPYKGGLRFHPSVDLGLLKFLAFEQMLKNSLTGLPMGGAKGGGDFDPKGRSEAEVRRFCQAFMTELYRHIGQFTDVPAGDIGVGEREIGFLFGQYKRITGEFTGAITGKGPTWGGSLIRPEATGFGVVYFAQEMLATRGLSLAGRRCVVSGSGNVALHTAQKLIDMGAVPVTLSDSDGFVVDPDGIDREKLAWIEELKNLRRGRVSEYAEHFPGVTYTGSNQVGPNSLWAVPADCAFPCATQNEIGAEEARALVDGGVILVAEGANMPTRPEGVQALREAGVMFGPSKAVNAGGVAVSGLEMAQNAEHLPWPSEQVDAQLRRIVSTIHATTRATAADYGFPEDYVVGANIAGFSKVADAMIDEGVE